MSKLILLTGIGRCGTGWLTFFMFLNSKIAVWDGPGMGELSTYVKGKTGLSLKDLHTVWKDSAQASKHSDKWTGARDFMPYYDKRLLNRRKSEVYFIAHILGERWWEVYSKHFDCNISCLYCGREIVPHFRSFKRWYFINGFSAEEFVGRLRESLSYMRDIEKKGIQIIGFNVADYSVKICATKAKSMMESLNIPMSKEQKNFTKKRRRLGKSPFSANVDKTKTSWIRKLKAVEDLSDDDLLRELKSVPDFEKVKAKYDYFRVKHEAGGI